MSALEIVIEELKSLPPGKFQEAASFIHGLREQTRDRKKAILDQTFGMTSLEDAERLAKDIEEGCEQIEIDD